MTCCNFGSDPGGPRFPYLDIVHAGDVVVTAGHLHGLGPPGDAVLRLRRDLVGEGAALPRESVARGHREGVVCCGRQPSPQVEGVGIGRMGEG